MTAALDRPIHSALTSRHTEFAQGSPWALRYHPDFGEAIAPGPIADQWKDRRETAGREERAWHSQ